MNTIRVTLTLLVIVGILFSTSQSLRFDIQSGHTRCIAEDIKSNSMTVGKYHIVNPKEGHPLPDSHKLTVRVTSSYGNSYHYGDHVDSGNFAFTAAEDGDYMACFWAVDHNPQITLTVDFDWRTGVHAKDWSNVAKKGTVDVKFFLCSDVQVESDVLIGVWIEIKEKLYTFSSFSLCQVMELELKKLFDTVDSIHQEMFYLRERESEMQQLNEATNSRMAWLSGLSLLICITVAGLQLWHLKTFFEKKKLI
ncbi:hypothetical protein Pint_23582 [Pistacia integerrima]|uniref:Uncharacterized protein n=1 Tax=Pistacia integerrima TaxID=434235 RepID=A0ACC0YJJ7_9ROSI|nr:hypothetical protein Pint_23582 [Pistacia integerrima]